MSGTSILAMTWSLVAVVPAVTEISLTVPETFDRIWLSLPPVSSLSFCCARSI